MFSNLSQVKVYNSIKSLIFGSALDFVKLNTAYFEMQIKWKH